MAAGILTGIGLAGLAIGIFWYREYDRTHKFRNIDTETFWLKADGEMTAEDLPKPRRWWKSGLQRWPGKITILWRWKGTR